MKKILILIVLIIAGYVVFNINKKGLHINLAEMVENNQAATTKISQGNNPSLERVVVSGVDTLVFKAKLVVENKDKKDISFSLFESAGGLGEISRVLKSGKMWTSYNVLTPVPPSKKTTIVNDTNNAVVNASNITAKANTKETYTVTTTVNVSDLADGVYVMRLHGTSGGYSVDGSSVKSISKNYSNAIEIKRATPVAPVVNPTVNPVVNTNTPSNTSRNIEPVSSQLSAYDLTRQTYGLEGSFRLRVTPSQDIDAKTMVVNVDFYDNATKKMVASTRANLADSSSGVTIIKKGVPQEIEFKARYSGYMSSLIKGGTYNAKISYIAMEPVNGGAKITETGLERFVTNNLLYTIDSNRETVFETPTKGTVWKKRQTNTITIKGYTGLIKDGETFDFVKNDVPFIKHSDYNIVFFKAGSFVKGQNTYQITVPNTLKTGDYFFRIGDNIKSEVFTIVE